MRRILLTGMSGSGKTTVIAALAAAGERAVDLDDPAWSEWVDVPADDPAKGTPVEPGRDWVWREDRLRALLAAADGGVLFAAGTAANMGPFLRSFDHVVLLHAPLDVLLARLAARPVGAYGARADERERVAGLVEDVEPLLRRAADVELDTRAPLADTVAAVRALGHGRGQA